MQSISWAGLVMSMRLAIESGHILLLSDSHCICHKMVHQSSLLQCHELEYRPSGPRMTFSSPQTLFSCEGKPPHGHQQYCREARSTDSALILSPPTQSPRKFRKFRKSRKHASRWKQQTQRGKPQTPSKRLASPPTAQACSVFAVTM